MENPGSLAKRWLPVAGLCLLLAGCGHKEYKDFAAFHGAPAADRQEEIRRTLKHASLPPDQPWAGGVGGVLAAPGIPELLDRPEKPTPYGARFSRVVPLIARSFRDAGEDAAPLSEGTAWLLDTYGLEGTERFIAACEQAGGRVGVHRAAVDAFRKARFEATWGPFSAWSGRAANAGAIADIVTVFHGSGDLAALRASYQREKSGNDRRARPERTVREPIHPQVSGVFRFVKALDRSAGEALFSASDGLFVLRLSDGDSFRAFPGQGVRMTMHNRGERMSMTDGSRLPVFVSGPSPTVPRTIPGYEPDRGEERRLAGQVAALEATVNRVQQALRKEGPDLATLDEASPVRLRFEGAKGAWKRVVILDAPSGRALYCSSMGGPSCPGPCEGVPFTQLLVLAARK
ncbi:MAG TPA: hypothetical protein VK188_04020 [Holophaga sp.]|nr:hypothetical protein [Holophaga sp.]